VHAAASGAVFAAASGAVFAPSAAASTCCTACCSTCCAPPTNTAAAAAGLRWRWQRGSPPGGCSWLTAAAGGSPCATPTMAHSQHAKQACAIRLPVPLRLPLVRSTLGPRLRSASLAAGAFLGTWSTGTRAAGRALRPAWPCHGIASSVRCALLFFLACSQTTCMAHAAQLTNGAV
jgi:hypothetical protein